MIDNPESDSPTRNALMIAKQMAPQGASKIDFYNPRTYTPPVVPQRSIAEDYKNGVPLDDRGNISKTIEGRPLTAQVVAGRSTLGEPGVYPDRGIDPKTLKRLGTEAGGASFLESPAGLLKGAVGTFSGSRDPVTGDRKSTFTLRDGLAFHNGQKVTSADIIASLPRAAKQDPMMQLMMKRLARMEAVDATHFRLIFTTPYALVEASLAGAGAMMMRAEDIAAAGDKPITSTIGSGPFKFNASLYTPGARIAFDRNPAYVSRTEPVDGMAGAKQVFVDRVEWQIIPDLQTRVSALIKGEVDLLDQLPHDGIQSLAGRKDVVVEESSKLGNMAFLRMNTLQPPFNDVRARRAMALLVDQKDYLSAAFTTDATWWRECFAWLGCGTENGSEVGSEPYRKPNPAEAKRLLAEAGYKGEKIVILTTQEIPLIDGLAQVTADKLRAIGVNVDVQASDWGTLVVRRAKKDPVEKGGWSIFQSGGDIATLAQPATNILIDARCDQNNYVGWPCSDRLETLRTALIEAPSGPKFIEYNKALWDELPSILLGQFKQPVAYRSTVSGLQHGLLLTFWNIHKN